MNMKLAKGYVLAVLVLLILAAAGILVLTNMDPWTLHVFWTNRTMPQSVWLLLAGAAGVVVWYTVVKLLPTAVASLREGKKFQQAQNDRKRLKNLEKSKGDSPKSGEN
ncbi:MAG: LapA family protein [Planctomycetota bacterium]|nr:LapA family protein [Planctomycetota bacterium]